MMAGVVMDGMLPIHDVRHVVGCKMPFVGWSPKRQVVGLS